VRNSADAAVTEKKNCGACFRWLVEVSNPMLRDLRFAAAILAGLVLLVVLQFAQPMLIYGDARDPEGEPIAGVLGAARHSRGAKDRAAASGSSTFFSGCLLCTGLRLRVSAAGYESESIRLSTAHDREAGDRVVVKRQLFGLVQRLHVTLYPELDVDPSRIDTELVFAAGEPRIVAALNPDLPDRESPEGLHARLRKLTRGRETVAAYVALESDVATDGSIVRAPVEPDDPMKGRWRNPTRARITLNNMDGGFIAVKPLAGIPIYNRQRETLRRLRKAPADGYRSTLPLEFDDAHFDNKYFYFYCRFGERYGKAELTAVEVSRSDPSNLRAHLRVWLNENGTRAMPTGR